MFECMPTPEMLKVKVRVWSQKQIICSSLFLLLFTSDLQFEHEVLTVMSKVYAPLRCLYQDLNYCIFRTKVALDQEIHNKEEKNT